MAFWEAALSTFGKVFSFRWIRIKLQR
jgi:hypothetical protein